MVPFVVVVPTPYRGDVIEVERDGAFDDLVCETSVGGGAHTHTLDCRGRSNDSSATRKKTR